MYYHPYEVCITCVIHIDNHTTRRPASFIAIRLQGDRVLAVIGTKTQTTVALGYFTPGLSPSMVPRAGSSNNRLEDNQTDIDLFRSR